MSIPTVTKKGIKITCIILEHRVANYGRPFSFLTNNGLQFVSRFFVAGCSTLGVNNLPTTDYYHRPTAEWNVLILL